VVLLTSPLLSPRHRLRLEITREVLHREKVAYEEVMGEGKAVLSQMMGLLYLGDWVSYYLAGLHGVDPSPTPTIELLKERLAQSPLEEA
jgi:glucose/mannose-6-phosphate isomerase